MSWVLCNKNINRKNINDILDNCQPFDGKVSIITSVDFGRIKLSFNKFNGISQKEYEYLVRYIIFCLLIGGVIDDYKFDKLTV